MYEKILQKDLRDADFEDIPDNFFDVISMSHVIEHIPNGEAVIEAVIPKLKKGDIIHIEFPGMRATELSRANKGFLNFFDDPTHIRLYLLKDIYNTLLSKNMRFIIGGEKKKTAFHYVDSCNFILLII